MFDPSINHRDHPSYDDTGHLKDYAHPTPADIAYTQAQQIQALTQQVQELQKTLAVSPDQLTTFADRNVEIQTTTPTADLAHRTIESHSDEHQTKSGCMIS